MSFGDFVAVAVAGDLGFPEVDVRFRLRRIAAALMSMPEAAVYHDRDSVLRQNDVRAAGQLSVLQAEAEAMGMKTPPYQDFRFGVFAEDAGHAAGSLGGGQGVGHGIA